MQTQNQNQNDNFQSEQPQSLVEQHAAVAGAGDAVVEHALEREFSGVRSDDEFESEEFEGSNDAGTADESMIVGATDVADTTTHVSLLDAVLMVTLDMTNHDVFAGSASSLKSVESVTGVVNAYNPFVKGGEGDDGIGIARTGFLTALSFVDSLNASNLALLGDDAQVSANLDSVLARMLGEIKASLPFAPEDEIGSITLAGEEEGDVDTHAAILMKDVVKVSGWISRDDNSGSTFKPYTLVINFSIAAGALYDESEPQKFINLVRAFMANAKKHNESNTGLVLGVTVLPEEIYLEEIREMMAVLFNSEDPKFDYTPLGRSLLQGFGSGKSWAPQSKVVVDRDLLTTGGDILIVKEF